MNIVCEIKIKIVSAKYVFLCWPMNVSGTYINDHEMYFNHK